MIRITLALGMLGTVLAVSTCSAGQPESSAMAPVTASQPSAAYSPQFTAVKTELGQYWIEDHGRRVALLAGSSLSGSKHGAGYEFGLFRQFPAQEIDEKAIREGTGGLGMPGLRLLTVWISAPGMRGVKGEMKLDMSDPRQVTIRLSFKKSAAEFGSQVLRVTYAPDMARYVVHVEDNLELLQPGGGEFCNIYAHGLGDFRPWVGRYDRLLYQDADDGGKLKAHYLSVVVPTPTRLIKLPPNGLVGFADEKDGNPVVIVEESTPSTMLGVCLCWYDLHLFWDNLTRKTVEGGRVDPPMEGPPYRYHVKFKAYWNSSAETGALLSKAQPVSLAPFADKFEMMLPLDMNVVNDFEHKADFLSGTVKHIYLRVSKTGGITYDTAVGRSGHSSVRCLSKTDKGLSTETWGPELMVTPGRQVKISAWVKTADVTGEGFYLESGFCDFDGQIGPKYCSAKLTGNNDWTLLEIPLPVTPEGTKWLGDRRILFRLSGKGTAWVDDFVFAEQDAGGPPVCDPHASVKP